MPKNFKPEMGAGDLGFTDLFGGRRVPKTHRRVKLNALIDELSALLGLVKTGVKHKRTKEEISAAQAALIRAAGLIAGMTPPPACPETGLRPKAGGGVKGALKDETEALAALIEARAAILKPLKKFVLPGTVETEALAHLARAKARVCEILAWELKAKAPAVYLNRLSDYLFLLALKSARK